MLHSNAVLDPEALKSCLMALKLSHHKTKKEAVATALNQYIQHKQQQEMLSFDQDFSHYAKCLPIKLFLG